MTHPTAKEKMHYKGTIAIVDDDQDVLDVITTYLKEIGFSVKGFKDATSFLKYLKHTLPHLIILDVKLPDLSGFEICKKLRSEKRYLSIPIIMLTGKGDEIDKVLGLELGADDYVTKPFSMRELALRIQAILRRKEPGGKRAILTIGNAVEINPLSYQVTLHGKHIPLTTTEFRILHMLAEHKGWVFSREQILDHLWGDEKVVLDRTVDEHMKNLRRKLGAAGRFLVSVRGVGYKIEV